MSPVDVAREIETVYLSGPMSGLPDNNWPAFKQATMDLRSAGFTVISPHETIQTAEGAAWTDCLRADIAAMLEAEAIILLPGWPKSRGARLELHIALALEMPAYYYTNGHIVRFMP
jgi:hypothetical protein